MKINPLDPSAKINRETQQATAKGKGDVTFQEILDQATAGSTTSPNRVSSLPGISGTTSLGLPSSVKASEMQAVQRLGSVLDGLSDFQSQLAKSNAADGDLRQAAEKLYASTTELEALAQDFSQEDPLGKLIQTGLVTARVEMLKFERGDYNE